MTPQQDNYMAP